MIDVVVMFFLFGLAAGLLRSELKLPASLYDTLSLFLLLAIGLKAARAWRSRRWPARAAVARGDRARVLQTLIAFAILRALRASAAPTPPPPPRTTARSAWPRSRSG